jgi:hypothetical protein
MSFDLWVSFDLWGGLLSLIKMEPIFDISFLDALVIVTNFPRTNFPKGVLFRQTSPDKLPQRCFVRRCFVLTQPWFTLAVPSIRNYSEN